MTLGASTPLGLWKLGIGDPTVWGWLITAGYFVAAGLCWRRWRREDWAFVRGGRGLFPRLWLALAVLMLLLGANKQLDLQTLVTDFGRRAAEAQGWYKQRRVVQGAFVSIVGAAGLVAGLLTWRRMRGSWARYWPAAVGVVWLGVFIVVRAASFHHIDDVLFKVPIVERFVSRSLEAAGIGLVMWGAVRGAPISPRPGRPSRIDGARRAGTRA